MNTFLVVVLAAAAAVTALYYVGAWVVAELRAWLLPALGAGGGLVAIVWAAVRLLRGVLSLHGLAYSFALVGVTWHDQTLRVAARRAHDNVARARRAGACRAGGSRPLGRPRPRAPLARLAAGARDRTGPAAARRHLVSPGGSRHGRL